MDEDIITLSSDEDNESPESSKPATKTSITTNNIEIGECLSLLKEKIQQNLMSVKSTKKNDSQGKIKVARSQLEFISCQTPEVVDLVDYTDKSSENGNSNDTKEEGDKVQNHSKTNGTNVGVYSTNKSTPLKKVGRGSNAEMPNDKELLVKIESDNEISTNKLPQASSKAGNNSGVVKNNCNGTSHDTKNQASSKSLHIFSEFINYCAALEENPKDREKLIEKLNKCFADADSDYVISEEFKSLIKKCRDKIHKSNLYLVAKTIADELKIHKNIENKLKEEPVEVKEKSQVQESEASNDSSSLLRQQKQNAKIQKVIKKLNQLGCTIRELEKQEVDLSDEEDSVYLKLQRFRERFWVVYKKLCEYTNDIDMDRVFNQKIHFTETNYPGINRCIEKWLNKTRSFPDFPDVLKILEGQSTELNLPSDKDSLRSIAIEIFQKVGNVLQIRRKYDLWNSFCGFLEDSEDPAIKNPELEKIFKENYEIRIKKEQEIYQLYAERQEKESLQPKEISEEDAYRSPESGNEEEEEIMNIEKSLLERITNRTTDKHQVKNTEGDKETNDDAAPKTPNVSSKKKESKNNFKNCKSLKWRSEKGGTSKHEGSDNSTPETDVDNGEKTTGTVQEAKESDPELILVEPDNQKNIEPSTIYRTSVSTNVASSPKKRYSSFGNENFSKKKCLTKNEINNIVDLREDGENLNKTPVFDIGYCHIVTNHSFKEKRKVFRDLTNLNHFMKNPGLRDKMAGLFTPTFLYSRNSLKKETPWNKRFKLNVREVKPKNQKCALNEEKKTREKIRSSSSRNSDEKETKENAGSKKEGAEFSGHGNGQEEDNNDKGDENRKNGKVEDENDDHEEDDDEEKEDENGEADEHSSNTQKTERENEDSLEPTNNESHKLVDTKTLKTENNETCTVENADQETQEEAEGEKADGYLVNNTDYDSDSGRYIGFKSKDSEEVEEFENLKNSLEPICVLKEGDTSDIIEKANNENPVDVCHQPNENSTWNSTEKLKEEKLKTGPFTSSKLRTGTAEKSKNERYYPKRLPVTVAWTPPAETSQPKPRKMSASDEERVKRFLMHSPSSISITPPKKLTLSKPPSQSALQALATLRNLKGISATIVKGKPKTEEDVTVIGGQSRMQNNRSCPTAVKRRRTDLPVISNVQSVNTLTPKIVTVQGNVSGFENLWPEMRNNGNTNSDSSSIRISKVWGSLPETIVQGNPSNYPGSSSRKSNPSTSNQVRKKNPKKQVEYVVLD